MNEDSAYGSSEEEAVFSDELLSFVDFVVVFFTSMTGMEGDSS
jgi:hypothetical protein